MAIVVDQVTKRFIARGQEVHALQPTSMTIKEGEFVAFVGPSGCGKSTLLNMIAGIFQPTTGTITHDGTEITGVNRAVGYMTQMDSLLPWRTVEQNVRLPLQIQGIGRDEIEDRLDRMLSMVNLSKFRNHFPKELSGGMRKRAALAQLLIYEPGTILMDEPFGALDAQLKLVMQSELLKIWADTKKTVVFVTHDLAEAISLAQRVIVFTGQPGTVKHISEIDLGAERNVFKDRFEKNFQDYYEVLWAELAPEIHKGEDL